MKKLLHFKDSYYKVIEKEKDSSLENYKISVELQGMFNFLKV